MAFNTTEQEIIKFGASNGKSRAEVEQAISNYRAGVVPTPKVVEQPESSVVSTYGKNLKEQFMGGVENAQKTLGYGVDTMQQAQQIPLDTKANKDRAIVTGIAGAGQVGAGAASGVVQTVFSPLTAAVTTGFSELNKATGGKMTDQITKIAQSNPELVQSISDYVTQNPKKVQFASDMLNILTAGLGGKAVGEVTKDIAKGVTTGIKESVGTAPTSGLMTESVGKLLSKANPTEAQAISNTYKGIMDVVENKKSLLQSFKKSEGSGKDPISLIAENPDYMVRINQEAKTIDANDSIANMRRDIADFSTVRDSLLATADETLPAIPTDKIIRDAITKFSAKNYSTYLDEGEKAVKDIVTKLQTLKKYNPQTVTRVEINNIRKGLDETINSFTDTKLKDRMRADLRSVFKTNLEQSIPESGLLSDLNAKIGDLLDASKFLETKLNGTKVKGGGLTDLAMKATGASIGATGLGGAMGGIPGAAAGYYLSDFISKTLIKNAINNPFDRAILDKLKSIRPDVVKRAEDYINQTTTKTTTTGQTELLKGVQPSTQSTPTVPKSKGIRGMVNPSELVPKKKVVSSLEQEAKKYKSAEEFVKAQGVQAFHGTPEKFNKFDISKTGKSTDSGMFGKGFYFTNDIKEAKTYSTRNGKTGEVKDVILNLKNPLVLNSKNDIPKINVPMDTIEQMRNADKNYSEAFTKYLKDNGFDGVIDKISGDKVQYVVLDNTQIKTKKELLDIWNKNNK